MERTRVSECGRFVVLEGVHIDRRVFVGLARWATARGLRAQDALQLAACALIGDFDGDHRAAASSAFDSG